LPLILIHRPTRFLGSIRIETKKLDRKLRYTFDLDRIFRLVLILIPLGVIGNVIFSIIASDPKAFFRLTGLSLHLFLLAAFFAFIPWLTYVLRVWIWVRFAGIRCHLHDLWKITLAQELGAAITPSAIGGAPVKAALLVQLGATPGKALSLMTLGSLEEWVFLLVVFPLLMILFNTWNLPVFSQLFDFALNPLWLIPLGLALALVIAMLAFCRKKRSLFEGRPYMQKLMGHLSTALRDFLDVYAFIVRKGKTRFMLTVTLTSLGWMSRLFVVGMLVKSMGMEVDFMLLATLQWIIFNAAVLMPTPGAAVGAEAMFYMLFKSYFSGDGLVLIMLGWRFLTFYLVNIVAALLLLGLLFGRSRISAMRPTSSDSRSASSMHHG
jgi:uncharacterized protein (TIRG00374 family)